MQSHINSVTAIIYNMQNVGVLICCMYVHVYVWDITKTYIVCNRYFINNSLKTGMGSLANRAYPDEMPHHAAFHRVCTVC